ncbi:MAG TPA: hydrogenase nickel incorporation protein HypB [Candidatus Bathyarchaeia archaeon]|nr:hydrogenase nickel incorporation protein HypB [Candidatus Bathyarchaeia archaeon]
MHKVEIEVGKDVLKKNKEEASRNLKELKRHDTRAFDILGSIGSGKTSIIERVVPILQRQELQIGAIAGDVVGEDDFIRMKALNIPVVNLNTGTECHLDAHLVGHAIEKLPLEKLDVLFIENVGNMVCPTDFELGTDARIVIVSVTEGDDVINKHPMIFRVSDIGIINKIDLAEAVGASVARMKNDMARIAPQVKQILTSAKTGEGITELVDELVKL